MKPLHQITVLAYDGCVGMQVFGLCDTLQLANNLAPAPLFEVRVASLSGGEVGAAGGLRIGTMRAPRTPPGLLLVPGMELGARPALGEPLTGLEAETAYLKRAFAKGRPVAALCVGAFLLGEAGLLDGRRATTCWMFAADLARRFPAAQVEPKAMLVEDGGITTTGAYSATFELALHLIRRAGGARLARAVASIGLLDARHSQAAYVDQALLPRPAGSFAASVAGWMTRRLAEPYDLEAMAAAFHISPRTLLRRFRQETGQSPLAHLQQARIDRARLLLETTAHSVARVTEAVGYGDVATFGALFKRLAGQSPAAYRRSRRTAAPD